MKRILVGRTILLTPAIIFIFSLAITEQTWAQFPFSFDTEGTAIWGVDSISSTDSDTLLFYNAEKAALRGGRLRDIDLQSDSVGHFSLAYGYHTKAIGDRGSIALGYRAEVHDDYGSSAIGNLVKTFGDFGSLTLGASSETHGDFGAAAIGYGLIANTDNAAVVGHWNDPITNPGDPVGSDGPVFMVGNGSGPNDRKNAMAVLQNGNIGMGTSDPSRKLHLHQQIIGPTNYLKFSIPGTGQNSNDGFDIGMAGNGDVAVWSYENEDMSFGTNNSLRMKISNTGNVGIGSGSSDPLYRLQVGVSGDGSEARANAWNTFSDRRWKKNFKKIDQVEKLQQINGYYFNWRDATDTTRQMGFIAQEIEQYFPEIVSTDAQGYKSLDYAKMTPVLLEAIKAQQKIIEQLQGRINRLENAIGH